MKKILFILLFLCAFCLFACGDEPENPAGGEGTEDGNKPSVIDEKKVFEEAEKLVTLPEVAYKDLELQSEVTALDFKVAVSYYSNNEEVLGKDGKVKCQASDVDVEFSYVLSFSYEGTDYTNSSVKRNIKVLSKENALKQVADNFKFPAVIRGDMELPTVLEGFNVQWDSSNNRLFSNKGKYTYTNEEVELTMTLTLIYGDDEAFYDKDFNLIIGPYEDEKRIELAAAAFDLPKEVRSNSLVLPTAFEYGVTGSWKASNSLIDVATGKIEEVEGDMVVVLTVKFVCGEAEGEKSFTVIVHPFKGLSTTDHTIIDRAKDFKGTYNNTELVDGVVVLKEGATEGSYESQEFDTLGFETAVGSWNCITSTTCTAELKVSVYVGGAWSKFFTYGEWGLGKENYYYNQTDSKAKMSVDEIIINTGYKATKVKYQVILKRDAANLESPKLSLVAFTFTIPGYSYPVSVVGLPNSVDYDVPKLYQHDVGVVGSVICSATTTTMLLKYKGYDFSQEAKTYSKVATWGVHEHGYIATLVADPGHNSPTYGNWTYNMAAAGALGQTAYFAKMYSFEELQYHLANYGPVGVSINGNFGIYTTGGHLLVCRGYRIANGQTTVICNDPNVRGVYYEVSLDVFMGAWRGNAYIFE